MLFLASRARARDFSKPCIHSNCERSSGVCMRTKSLSWSVLWDQTSLDDVVDVIAEVARIFFFASKLFLLKQMYRESRQLIFYKVLSCFRVERFVELCTV